MEPHPKINTSTQYNVIEMNAFNTPLYKAKRNFKDKPDPQEVLIKIHYATIHPCDEFFALGAYGDIQPKVFPVVPGFEASGEIIQVGEKVDKSNIGKRVCLFQYSWDENNYQGVWGEYTYAEFDRLLVFDISVPFEDITFAILNPLTVCGFVDYARKAKVKAVIQTAAFSAVGKILVKLCAKEKDIKTINLVRKSEQVKLLKELGADYVINTNEENWQEELKKLAKELDARMCFECIGGDMAAKILGLMPYGSTVYHYGNLLFKPVEGLSSVDLIFFNKRVSGYWFETWLKELNEQDKKYWFDFVVNEFTKNTGVFGTQLAKKKFKLADIQEAIKYYQKNMSEGKILLEPSF